MAELSDSFKQLDTVEKLRYKEKLGMLGVTPFRVVSLQKLAHSRSKAVDKGELGGARAPPKISVKLITF